MGFTQAKMQYLLAQRNQLAGMLNIQSQTLNSQLGSGLLHPGLQTNSLRTIGGITVTAQEWGRMQQAAIQANMSYHGRSITNQATPSPRDPLPTAGMKVEDLIGWRVWRVKNGHLWSFSADYAWMPGDVSEGVPGDHDSAGIWAFKDKRRAFQKAIGCDSGYVWGSVLLWGHVVEHDDGYRASKARIISIGGATRYV